MINDRRKRDLLINIAYATILLILVCACFDLFMKMSVNLDGNYKSDLTYYISKANETARFHRLPYFLFRFLYGITDSTLAISIYLSVQIGCICIANYLYIKNFVDINAKKSKTKALALTFSVEAIFAGPIYIPNLTHFYKKMLPTFAWHSPTQQAMTLFAVLGMICFFKMFRDYEKGISPFWWCMTALFYLVSAYAKPSFIIDLVPAMAVAFIIELVGMSGLRLLDRLKKLFIMACSLIPSGIYMIGLSYILYFSSEKKGDGAIVMGSSDTMTLRHFVLIITTGITFAIIVMIANYKKIMVDRKCRLILLIAITGFLQGLLLGETGRRANHGNFEWGKMIGSYLLTLTCLAIAVDNYGDEEFLNGRKILKYTYYAFLGITLLLQVFSQIYYVYTISIGKGYYR